MPLSKAAQKSRAANKLARSERRERITDRWEFRNSRREGVQRFAAEAPNLTVEDATNALLRYVPFIAPGEMIAAWQSAHADVIEKSAVAWALVEHLLRVIELKEMSYQEYLQTPEWKGRSARTKERFEGLCALDASHVAVDAHHRTYRRRGRELAIDLIPLCRECHDRFHKNAA